MLEWILDCERETFLWLNSWHTPFRDSFMWIYSGKAAWVTPLTVIAIVIARRKNWKESLAIFLFIALVITLCDQFASGICKPCFMRLRPTGHPDFMEHVHTVNGYRGGRYGFISSHAANAFGFAVFTLLLFRDRWYTVVILLWATLMAYTRIYLGVHFISDIVPAIFSGSLFGYTGYRLYLFARRKIGRQTSTPPSFSHDQIRLIIAAIALTVAGILL
ncbi:MAG: phosphatase PAP2 family protein, partial [Tannerella sp.]|nr:phosphatase PAP2 family protein [Tannerella sp.]